MNGIIQTDVICLYKKINHNQKRVDCLEFDVVQDVQIKTQNSNDLVYKIKLNKIHLKIK